MGFFTSNGFTIQNNKDYDLIVENPTGGTAIKTYRLDGYLQLSVAPKSQAQFVLDQIEDDSQQFIMLPMYRGKSITQNPAFPRCIIHKSKIKEFNEV